MEFVLEVILQFLGEVLFQLLVEGLFRLGLRSLGETFGRPRGNAWSTVGFILWGAMAGGISLLILPSPFLHSPVLRIANLVLTPVAVAAIMTGIGRRRLQKGRDADALDRFGNAYFFALAMTSVRYLWAV